MSNRNVFRKKWTKTVSRILAVTMTMVLTADMMPGSRSVFAETSRDTDSPKKSSKASGPGYRHNSDPYDTAENTASVLTITGDKFGRERNYSVSQLENLVYTTDAYPILNSKGWQGQYSLSDSSSWYTNEYQGVQLWKLLQHAGVPATGSTDENTKVTFGAADGYTNFDSFSLAQIANPHCFGFYEKNPLDKNDGTYKPTASDLKNTGYPVLVAYGVNNYPYVISSQSDGYNAAAQNDGGPLRLISGKTDYQHTNGSKQVKWLNKIVVGEDKYHYSTHKYHQKDVYKNIADDPAVKVTVNSTPYGKDDPVTISQKTYSAGEIEEILYKGELRGQKLNTSELAQAKVKDYYTVKEDGNFSNDIFEGMDLNWFMQNVVQVPGTTGTVTFKGELRNSDGAQTNAELTKNLEDILAWSGTNRSTEKTGLPPLLAYSKNGAPLVAGKDGTPGYEGQLSLASGTDCANNINILNDGGPLRVIFPEQESTTSSNKSEAVLSVKEITIDLKKDTSGRNGTHVFPPYDTYKDSTVTVSGNGTKLSGKRAFTVADLESKQNLVKESIYKIKHSSGTADILHYRGVSLYDFLNSPAVGLKENAKKVIVTSRNGSKQEFSLDEVKKSDYIGDFARQDLSMILAYCGADDTREYNLPLVRGDETEDGAGNDGGPIKLMVGLKDENDINYDKCLEDVESIQVTAGWKHSDSGQVYKQYLNNKLNLTVIDNNNKEMYNKNFTVEQLEAMTSLAEHREIEIKNTNIWEGINLWKFVQQEARTIPGIDNPTSVMVSNKNGQNKDLQAIFGIDQLKNGIKDGQNRVPILLGYSVDGYPLVSGGESDTPGQGYDSDIGNNRGPIRLLTHKNQGTCLGETAKIVIKVNASSSETKPTEPSLTEKQQSAMKKTLSKSIKLTTSAASHKSVKLKWNKVSGSGGYVIYQSTKKNSSFKKIKTITKASSTTYTKSGLKTGKTYYYKVRAYGKAGGKTLYGKFSAVKAAKPSCKAAVIRAKTRSYSAVIQWKKVSGGDRYQVYRASSKKGPYKRIGTVKGTSLKDNSMTGGKTYYYKIRAYTKVGKKKVYGKFSSVKSAKIKPYAPSFRLKSSNRNVKITWKKASGARKYQVYCGVSKKGKYYRIRESVRFRYVHDDSRLKKGKTYYYKMRTYAVVNGKRIYSKFTPVKKIKVK